MRFIPRSLLWPKVISDKMLTSAILGQLRSSGQRICQLSKRHIGVSAVALQKNVDPIQQLFVDKLREYVKKKQSAGGKLVDASPEIQKDYDEALDRVNQRFGAAGKDMTKFPEFKFEDKPLEGFPKVDASKDQDSLPL